MVQKLMKAGSFVQLPLQPRRVHLVAQKAKLGLVGVLLLVMAAGCGSIARKEATGQVRVFVAAAEPMQSETAGLNLYATLTKDALWLQQPMTSGAEGWSTLFPAVYIGRWHLLVQAVEATTGRIVLSGETDVLVEANTVNLVEVTLKPEKGELNVEIDLTGVTQAKDVAMCVVRTSPAAFGSSSTEKIFRHPDTGEWRGLWRVPAGTYDLSVELYTATTMTDSLLYASPWQRVDIEPGKTTLVKWAVQTGQVSVGGVLDPCPDPPTGLTASIGPEGITLSWLAPNPYPADLNEYVIYVRRDLFEHFEVLDRVAPDQLTYVYLPEEEEIGCRLAFAVAASDGRSTSKRSEEVEVVWQPAAE
ncbi:MAG: fibronectin type III domain-containing protein [Limnochordales bacterium]|nr:fibronectin type III domain-containing protein [Limnochordales bacterium]